MRAFLTGSRAYGKPKKTSDIDLVVLMSQKDLEILKKLSHKNDWDMAKSYEKRAPQAACFRFGNLNLIVCTTKESYLVWKKGTAKLKAQAPVKRSMACGLFAELRALHLEGVPPDQARARGERVRKKLEKLEKNQ